MQDDTRGTLAKTHGSRMLSSRFERAYKRAMDSELHLK